MINVFIDTNIFRKNPSLDNAAFRALARLASNSHLKLHIPYIVYEEFITQKIDEYEKHISSIENSINNLVNKKLHGAQKKKILSYLSGLAPIKKSIQKRIRADFDKWISKTKAKLHPLQLSIVEKAFQAYFAGLPPFKEKKNRKDIPDSLIFETIKTLALTGTTCRVIVEDSTLRDACNQIDGTKTYSTLDEFIGSTECQVLLKEQYVADKFEHLIETLKENSSILNDKLETLSIDSLAWKQFHDESIPDDNGEATIQSVGSLDDINFLFEDAKYFGDGVVGIPFEFATEILAYYFIFKSDYYSMSDERSKRISVSDHNDHYFEAEQYFYIAVGGLLSIKMNLGGFSEGMDIANTIDYESCEIDEITDISVVD